MNISACVITYNEEQNIPRLMESLKDCEEVFIADGGSTDKTVELANSLGAQAYLRENLYDTPTQSDIDEFEKQFGWLPQFTLGSKFRRSADMRNEVMKRTKNDWVFYPDADEFVTWNFPQIQKLTESCDQIACPLVQRRDDNGNPTYWNKITKLFNKNKCRWVGRTHEVIVGTGEITVPMETMKIDHFQKPGSQTRALRVLEYCAIRDGDARNLFYLGRQYYDKGEYQKSLDVFDRHIMKAFWRPEIAYAFLLRARAAWELHLGDKARAWCLNAIAINPDFKEALAFMAEITGDDQSPYWKKYADIATSNDVLFVDNR